MRVRLVCSKSAVTLWRYGETHRKRGECRGSRQEHLRGLAALHHDSIAEGMSYFFPAVSLQHETQWPLESMEKGQSLAPVTIVAGWWPDV